MASSTNITNITPPRVPFIDESTGLISRQWYRFLLNLYTITGNGSQQPTLGITATAPLAITSGQNPTLSVDGAPFTTVNDSNVTLTLTGTPLTSLLKTVTLTAGWSGTLAASRGGTAPWADQGAVFTSRGVATAPAWSNSPVAFGYVAGAGSAVTQTTSRTTGVTINAPTGAITMVSAAGSSTPATFTVTNSTISATDTVVLSVQSGASNSYSFNVSAVAAGNFNITFWAQAGTATDAPVINFAVLKGSAS